MQIPFPNKKYNVILADPAWSYRDHANSGNRGAIHKYDCMTIDEIKALPVRDIAADNCALFMWVTNPFLREAFEVFDAWGFIYKTKAFEWVKLNKSAVQRFEKMYKDEVKTYGEFTYDFESFLDELLHKITFMGMGNYTRQNDEQCLLAVRGHAPERIMKNVHSVIYAERRAHSQKPDEQYSRIESLYGDVTRIELFARQSWPHWDSWGLEAPNEGEQNGR